MFYYITFTINFISINYVNSNLTPDKKSILIESVYRLYILIITSLINIKNNCMEDKQLCDNIRSNILSNEYINNIKTELNDST